MFEEIAEPPRARLEGDLFLDLVAAGPIE